MPCGIQGTSLGLENITPILWETCTPLEQQLGTIQDTPDTLMVPDARSMQNNLSPDQYYAEPRKTDFYRWSALTRSPLAIKDIKHLTHNTPEFKSQSDTWSHN